MQSSDKTYLILDNYDNYLTKNIEETKKRNEAIDEIDENIFLAVLGKDKETLKEEKNLKRAKDRLDLTKDLKKRYTKLDSKTKKYINDLIELLGV